MWADPFEDTVGDACSLVSGLTEFNVAENPEAFRAPTLEEYIEQVTDVVKASFDALDRVAKTARTAVTREYVAELLGDPYFAQQVFRAHEALWTEMEDN